MQIGNIGRDFNEYQDDLAKLINSFNIKYKDVLYGKINEDELWNTVMDVRGKIREGRSYINNDKNLEDLENIIINLSNQRNGFQDADNSGDKLEASRFKREFLVVAQRYIDDVVELKDKLDQAHAISHTVPSPDPSVSSSTDESPDPSVSSSTDESPDPSVSSSTDESPDPSVSSSTDESPDPSVSSSTDESPDPSVSSSTDESPDPSVSAPEIPRSAKKKAIVIGINKYHSLPVEKNLQGAQNDANEIYNILKKNGFTIDDTDFLLGDKATYRAISKSINNSFRRRIDYGTILFYFSGHGFADENKDVFIAPYDVDPEDPYVCGINIEELNRVMDKSNNNSKIVTILDCCYAGKAIEGAKGNSEGIVALDDSFKKIGSIDKNRPTRAGKIVLASSQANESAHEKKFEHDGTSHYHGIFSYYLIEGLLGKAIPTREGDITPNNIYNYIKEQMKSDGTQKITYGAQIQQDGINIALASYGEKDNQIKGIFEIVNYSIMSAKFPDLIFAAKRLWLLEDPKLNPHLNDPQKLEYCTIKKTLNNSLFEYGKALHDWFDENETEEAAQVFNKIFRESRKNIYSELGALCANLSYEIIAKITDQDKRCLMAVFRFMNSTTDEVTKLEELERELDR